MNIKLIKTESDYNQALELLETNFDAKKETIRQIHEKLNIPTDVLIQRY